MLLLTSPWLMWSTGNFKTSEGDAASRRSCFGGISCLWLPSLDGSSKVEFYKWSNVEFTASGHTTLSKWASCFSWAKAFVNNLQRDFKPNQRTKHGTRTSRNGGGQRQSQSGQLSAVSLSHLLPCSWTWHIQEHPGTGNGAADSPDLQKAERTPRAWAAAQQLKNFLVQVPSWYLGMKKTSETQLQVRYSQLNPIWAV